MGSEQLWSYNAHGVGLNSYVGSPGVLSGPDHHRPRM